MQSRRQGFTLVELLIVMVLGSLVLGAVYQTLVSQQRSTRQTYAIIETQQNTRIGLDLIATDLREVSATDGDLIFADSNAIRYRALRKGGIVCAIGGGSSWIDVAEIGDPFAANDSTFIFNDGANPNSAIDDSWTVAMVQSVGSGACGSSPISVTIRRLSYTGSPLVNVQIGAPVRSFQHIGFRLVNEGSKGVLYRIRGADSVAVVDNLRPRAQQGLRLRYWDSVGVAIPDNNVASRLRQVGRVQVKLTGSLVGGGSGPTREFTDSLVTTVFLRGNRKLR